MAGGALALLVAGAVSPPPANAAGAATALSFETEGEARAPRPAAANAGLPQVERRTALVRTVESVQPAVVNVSTRKLVRVSPRRRSWFDLFFPTPDRHVQDSLGSGVIVDPSGYVITNDHVVATASQVSVTLLDGRQVEAEIVGRAPGYDLALLELAEPGPYPWLPLDFDGPLHPGETVIAIGNPFGLQSTVTTGVLSATARRITIGGNEFTDVLQTDAAINPGNSGGALLTVAGDLIGINTQIVAEAQNLGFAIPAARARKVFDELVRYGEVRSLWLGITVGPEDLARRGVRDRLGRPLEEGVLVESVLPEGPAARAGLRPGDVVLELDGTALDAVDDFFTVLSRIAIGDEFAVDVWREGRPRRLVCRAEAFPVEKAEEVAWRHLGLTLDEVGTRDGPRVVVERVRRGSPAARAGLRPGLVVSDARRLAVSEERVYRSILAGLDRGAARLVVSDGRSAAELTLRPE